MSAITLQFSAQHDLASEAIEWFSAGLYSHVDTVMPDGRLLGARNDVCAGVPAGVQVRPAGYATFLRHLVVVLPCDPAMADAYYAFLTAQLGKPYDRTAIVAFVFGRNWQDEDSWFCSELCAAGLCRARYFPYELAAPANRITPDGLLLACSARVNVAA